MPQAIEGRGLRITTCVITLVSDQAFVGGHVVTVKRQESALTPVSIAFLSRGVNTIVAYNRVDRIRLNDMRPLEIVPSSDRTVDS